MATRGVLRFSISYSKNEPQWLQPFNSLMVVNYDVNAGVTINNDITLPPALSITDNIGAKVIPSSYRLGLNENEVNSSKFKFNTNSATAAYVLSWTEYADHK